MQKLITSFEAFSSAVASERTRNRLRRAVSFIPVIDGVVSACGGIPYYYEHANNLEKGAMILSAVLLVTALALTIAVYASPAIAGVPLLWPAITACVLLSRVLYDQASTNAREKYEAKKQLSESGVTRQIKGLEGEMSGVYQDEFLTQTDKGIKNMETATRAMINFAEDTEHRFPASNAGFRSRMQTFGRRRKRDVFADPLVSTSPFNSKENPSSRR